jgi:hypothetical protein
MTALKANSRQLQRTAPGRRICFVAVLLAIGVVSLWTPIMSKP